MRTILYTGKGGVGKTSIAAATALLSARLGRRTLVLSTDRAHSLADSLDIALNAEPKLIAPNLWAQEVDVYHEIHHHWHRLQKYILQVLTWRGLDGMLAEEMTVFPGMEELSSLLLLTRYRQEAAFDVCVIDCAPTGETLRLLSFPEAAGWWLRSVLPFQRRISQLIRPIAKHLTDMPLPDDKVFESIQFLLGRLDDMRRLLADPEKSTVRLVLNPEKTVIKEAQRTYTYLNLYNYGVDAVICNRMIPDSVTDAYFSGWKEAQARYLRMVEECFAPLPVLQVPLLDEEIVGVSMLERLGETAFGDQDPTRVFFRGQTHVIAKAGDAYVLSISLPFASKPDVEMLRAEEELIVRVGNERRNILLPRALATLEAKEAKLQDGVLRVRFEQ